MTNRSVSSFSIEEDDFEAAPPKRKRAVVAHQKRPRYEQLSEDALWLLEEDLRRLRRSIEQRGGELTDKEHGRLIRSAEQARKLRATQAQLQQLTDPSELDDENLAAELKEELRKEKVPQETIDVVFRVLGLGESHE